MSKADHSDDSSTEIDSEQSFGDDFMWFENDDDTGMFIGRENFSTYVLGFQSFSVRFDDIRADDEDDENNTTFELRDGYDVQGTFDPNGDNVPANVATAFRVLAHEI